jgi:hypothetical protein
MGSSIGGCYDNALCESPFATFECKLLDRRRFRTQAEARMAVFEFLVFCIKSHDKIAMGILSKGEPWPTESEPSFWNLRTGGSWSDFNVHLPLPRAWRDGRERCS